VAASLASWLLTTRGYPPREVANVSVSPRGPRGISWSESERNTKGASMYIGGGVITLIVIILLLVWIF
jgi:hypothetical protein